MRTTFSGLRNFCHLDLLLSISEGSLSSLILYTFLLFKQVYKMYISLELRASNPVEKIHHCWVKAFVTSIVCCKSINDHFNLWFYSIYHDFTYVYSPMAGTDNPKEIRFWCQQKPFVHFAMCCKFQRDQVKIEGVSLVTCGPFLTISGT